MMQRVWIRPLVLRPEVIHRLLDRIFEEHGSSLRGSHMSPENQRALRAHSWDGNFASLRQAAGYLMAIARSTSILQAAHALGVPPSTFYHWYSKTMGLTGKSLTSSSE